METIPNNLGFEFHRSNKLRAWIYTGSQGMLWNGMEWKMVWNGRRILVWNMKDAQNETVWKI